MRRAVNQYQQRGIVLIVVLVFLVLASMLTTTSMRTSMLDQKMLSNYRDHDIAFQAAEATLINAERYLADNEFAISQFTSSCQAGLCLPNSNLPIWNITPTQNLWQTAATSLPALQSALELAAIPQYLIEWMEAKSAASDSLVLGKLYSEPPKGGGQYRISARAQGKTTQSAVILQSIFHR